MKKSFLSIALFALCAPAYMTEEATGGGADVSDTPPVLTESQESLLQRVRTALEHGFEDVEQFFKDGLAQIESFITDKKAVASDTEAKPDAEPEVAAPTPATSDLTGSN